MGFSVHVGRGVSTTRALFSTTRPSVGGVAGVSTLVLSLLFYTIKLYLLFFSSGIRSSSSTSNPILLINKVTFLITKNVHLVVEGEDLVCIPANDLIGGNSYFFSTNSLSMLKQLLRRGAFSNGTRMLPGGSNNIQVSCVISRSNGFTTIRLLGCIPCTCRPTSSMLRCAKRRTDTFIGTLQINQF